MSGYREDVNHINSNNDTINGDNNNDNNDNNDYKEDRELRNNNNNNTTIHHYSSAATLPSLDIPLPGDNYPPPPPLSQKSPDTGVEGRDSRGAVGGKGLLGGWSQRGKKSVAGGSDDGSIGGGGGGGEKGASGGGKGLLGGWSQRGRGASSSSQPPPQSPQSPSQPPLQMTKQIPPSQSPLRQAQPLLATKSISPTSPSAAIPAIPLPVLSTTLSQSVKAGENRLQVASQAGCTTGMLIHIGSSGGGGSGSASGGGGSGEKRKIVGFGSLLLDSPLNNSYPAGTTVVVYPVDVSMDSHSATPVNALRLTGDLTWPVIGDLTGPGHGRGFPSSSSPPLSSKPSILSSSSPPSAPPSQSPLSPSFFSFSSSSSSTSPSPPTVLPIPPSSVPIQAPLSKLPQRSPSPQSPPSAAPSSPSAPSMAMSIPYVTMASYRDERDAVYSSLERVRKEALELQHMTRINSDGGRWVTTLPYPPLRYPPLPSLAMYIRLMC